MNLSPDISLSRTEIFQGLESGSPGFSEDWKISQKTFQALEKSPGNFPSLGKPRLWLVDLDTAVDFDREDWLDAGELARARRLRSPLERRRFVRSHATARLLLAQQLGVEPAAVVVEHTATGKPFVTGVAFDFSLSHSENILLFGLHHGGAVGVDVEVIRDDFDVLPVAEDFFTSAEVTELRAATMVEQQRLFRRLWTNHEARAKAAGKGVGQPVAGEGWNGLQAEIIVLGNPAALAVVWRN